jgi:hypothetical protein
MRPQSGCYGDVIAEAAALWESLHCGNRCTVGIAALWESRHCGNRGTGGIAALWESRHWESLSQNHPFVDGNKRTAIASMAAHLTINGFGLQLGNAEAYGFLMEMYESGRFRSGVLETWLRSRVFQQRGD